MHLDTKKLSATRNFIFDLHDLLGGWYLAHPLFQWKNTNTAFLLCFALPCPGGSSLARLGLDRWVDGYPHWHFSAFRKRQGLFIMVEGWGTVKLVFNEAFFGVSGTEHFFAAICLDVSSAIAIAKISC